jgi:conjugal transfer/entry exclusion protein
MEYYKVKIMPGKKILQKIAKRKKTTKKGVEYGPDYKNLDDVIERKYSNFYPNITKSKTDVSNLNETFMRNQNPYKNVWNKKKSTRPDSFWEIKGYKDGGAVGPNGIL